MSITASHYIAAIISTLALCLSYIFKTRNREVDLSVNILLCLFVSAIWSGIIVHEVVNYFFPGQLSETGIVIISAVLACFMWCLLVILTWRKTETVTEEDEVVYTTETLIGMPGWIVGHEGKDLYLGYLNDRCKSQIYIHIKGGKKIEPDTEFVITDIVGDKIYAKVAE